MSIKDKPVLVTGAIAASGRHWRPKPWPEAPTACMPAPASRCPTKTTGSRL